MLDFDAQCILEAIEDALSELTTSLTCWLRAVFVRDGKDPFSPGRLARYRRSSCNLPPTSPEAIPTVLRPGRSLHFSWSSHTIFSSSNLPTVLNEERAIETLRNPIASRTVTSGLAI